MAPAKKNKLDEAPSNAKKAKIDNEKVSDDTFQTMLEEISKSRSEVAKDVSEYKFNKKRVRLLTGNEGYLKRECKAIAYWMHRDQRVQDNWALLYAQKLAMENNLPLHVVDCLSVSPEKHPEATLRVYDFVTKALAEVEAECHDLDIGFHVLVGPSPAENLLNWMDKFKVGCVVADFSPLRHHRGNLAKLEESLKGKNGPCLYQVDSHNVVPCWYASEKQEYGARTIRKKIMDRLPEFLVEFPPVVKHQVSPGKIEPIDWEMVMSQLEYDKEVGPTEWAQPGTEAGLRMLKSFVDTRLKIYAEKRNDPNVNALSNLSPWFHFGQVSTARAVMYAKKHSKAAGVAAFVEETLVRGELSDNFCYYNDNYDKVEGAYDWAKTSLNLHRKDKRQYIYTRDELANSLTHDDLWNSAQIQLVKEGKMQGFLRMYWAKKILEWTESPEQALEFALYLNDHYSLDGADSNGFVGCMWSICGIHDQGWAERPIFGKIRYMNYEGCKRKFDINAFIARYGGKKHSKKQ